MTESKGIPNSLHQPPLGKLGYFLWPLLLLMLTLLLQYRNGAPDSDFGGHADEGAHVVTSLMVRDYLAGPLFHLQNPLHYAQDYYARFPKVALLHYPPGFYLVLGTWLLPFRTKGAILACCALITAIAGWLTFRLIRRSGVSAWGSVAGAVVFVLLPLVQTYTAIVMSDIMVVALSNLALLRLMDFLEHERARDALLFGLFAALTILTKAAGLYLALVPPLAILLSGRWQILRNRRLWLAPIPVIVLALPWMLISSRVTAKGMSSEPLKTYIAEAASFYPKAVVHELGWGACLLILLSIVLLPRIALGDSGRRIIWSVHWGVILGLLVFYIATPSGLDERYLLPLIPSVLALALMGAESFSRADNNVSSHSLARLSLGLCAAFLVLTLAWRPTGKSFRGEAAAVELAIANAAHHPNGTLSILVSGSANTEGAIVAAAALDPRHNSLKIVRAFKVLADADWMASDYKIKYQDGSSLLAYLDQDGIDDVILDSPGPASFPHEKLLAETLGANAPDSVGSSTFHLTRNFVTEHRGSKPGALLLFERSLH
jgi:hypothetical protein